MTPSSVIVALDFDSQERAIRLVHELGPRATSYKVGLQLLTEAGPDVVRELVAMGKNVFLDLKLHEIPTSVAAGVTAAGNLGASMVTVHASSGSAVLQAAVRAAAAFPGLSVLALTVITSLTDSDLPEVGLAPSVRDQVARLALLAASAGCHGVVASANEASYLSTLIPAGKHIVTPGIHLPDTSSAVPKGDQARIATPRSAAAAGATHVVIGRAITASLDPPAAFGAAVAGFEGKL